VKLEDPELAALVDGYRETQRPSERRRRKMRDRLEQTTARRPAWQVYGMTAALAAAALLVIWLGARLFDGNRQERADASVPVQAPRESAPQRDGGRAEPRKAGGQAKVVKAPQPEPAPQLPAPRKIEPRAAPPKAPSPPPTIPTTETKPDDELALIVKAEAALRANHPERVLRLLQTHERRHPSASTSEERSALRILALCKLGRIEEGRGLRHSFLEQYAASAYRSRIESACPRP